MCDENNVVASTLYREHALDEIRQNGLLPEPKRARNPIHVYHVGRLQSIREAEHWRKQTYQASKKPNPMFGKTSDTNLNRSGLQTRNKKPLGENKRMGIHQNRIH